MGEILKEYALKALTWLESGTAWVAGEIPLYIAELLRWNLAVAITAIVISIMLVITAYIVFRKMIQLHGASIKSGKNCNGYRYDGEWLFLWFGVAIPCIVAIPLFVVHFLEALKILVAPRVYLLEYVTELLS